MKHNEIVPVWLSDEQFMPDLQDMEEGKVYISMRYRTSAHKCMCGCGELTIMPIGDKGVRWLLTENNGRVTFAPSVANWGFSCRSHYYITDNNVKWV
jgi:hypothetical protein